VKNQECVQKSDGELPEECIGDEGATNMDHREIGCRWNWLRNMSIGGLFGIDYSGSTARGFEYGNFFIFLP
jgi:hypothetical protein